VLVRKDVEKGIGKLPDLIRKLVAEALDDLAAQGPWPHGWNVKQIGSQGYRLRLTYRYRMRYAAEQRVLLIQVIYVGHRKDAYE